MFRTAVESDIDGMKDKLRPADAAEVAASHGQNAQEALTYSFHASDLAITIVHKGRPVAMFGIAPDPAVSHAATVWLLATNELKNMWLTFLKVSHGFIGMLLEHYPVLYNYVDARNTTSIEWLTWCGAEFHQPEPYGAEQLPFRFFVIQKEKAHV